MTKAEKTNWLINLEDVAAQVDAATIDFICRKYGARDIYELSPYDYQEAWNELYYYAVENNDN